jgi:hypothetical protein
LREHQRLHQRANNKKQEVKEKKSSNEEKNNSQEVANDTQAIDSIEGQETDEPIVA